MFSKQAFLSFFPRALSRAQIPASPSPFNACHAGYISLGAFGPVVSVTCLESETGLGRKSVWISMTTGITTPAPIKVVVALLGHYFILRNSRLCFFCNYVG